MGVEHQKKTEPEKYSWAYNTDDKWWTKFVNYLGRRFCWLKKKKVTVMLESADDAEQNSPSQSTELKPTSTSV